MKKKYKIVFTGGGSAGHVIPSIPIINALKKLNWDIYYIGSKAKIEYKLITKENIVFYGIASGKIRRYFSIQNFLDLFKVLYGIIQSIFLLRKLRPDILFSKGGYVAFPVVIAAWINRIPVITHESDVTPGLANKLSYPFSAKICLTFKETLSFFKDSQKTVVSGTPIRDDLLSGDPKEGQNICSFKKEKMVILIIGGSIGSDFINTVIREQLSILLKKFNIVHICGAGKISQELKDIEGYKQFEFVSDELPHLLSYANIVISRAGANAIFELLALNKPHILVPLSLRASRGEQIKNANISNKLYGSEMIEEDLLSELLIAKLDELTAKLDVYNNRLRENKIVVGNEVILNTIKDVVNS